MKILVPTDFTPLADFAVDTAIKLAGDLNAEIILVHTIEINHVWEEVSDFSKLEGMIEGDYSYMHVAKIIATKKLKEIQTVLEKNEIPSRIEVLEGKPHHRIVEYIAANEVDLVLMATHGADGLKEVFIGSNAQKIIRNSTCPVLTVKLNEEVDFSEIVFVSDFNENEQNVLKFVQNLSKDFDSKITFLKVITPLVFSSESEIEEEIKNKVADVITTNFSVQLVKAESVEEGITEYCEKNKVGLVSIATHGKGFFRKVFVSNTTEYLVNHLDKPVLSLPFNFKK